MPRYLWNLDDDGWPLERIDSLTGEHVPVITGDPDESLHPQGVWRPIACCYPRKEGGRRMWILPNPSSARDIEGQWHPNKDEGEAGLP